MSSRSTQRNRSGRRPVNESSSADNLETQYGSILSYQKPAPFCNDPDAVTERERVDYSIRITKEEACAGSARRRVRVYADGVYDMFHSGHARQLMQVKRMVPGCYLIVGVTNDQLTEKMKGQTVMKDSERYEAVRHCRYVDEVLIDAPWSYGLDHLEKYKIDFVAHDDIPYQVGDNDDMYKEMKEKGMFLATQRTEGISTTDVIARIVRDYDTYVRRNLSRGASRKDLNISYVKEKRLRIQEKYESMKRKGSDIVSSIGTKRKHLFDKWEETSNVLVDNFIAVFGIDGRLSHWWNEKRAQMARAISPPGSPVHGADGDDDDDDDYDSAHSDEEEEEEEAGQEQRGNHALAKRAYHLRVDSYAGMPTPAKRRAVSANAMPERVGGH